MSDDRKQIKRALISVYDKTGLEELARTLDGAGVEIVSTGSTAARLQILASTSLRLKHSPDSQSASKVV